MSKGFPFVRMDFYDVNGKIYFGEYTFFPASGMMPIGYPKLICFWEQKIVLPSNSK